MLHPLDEEWWLDDPLDEEWWLDEPLLDEEEEVDEEVEDEVLLEVDELVELEVELDVDTPEEVEVEEDEPPVEVLVDDPPEDEVDEMSMLMPLDPELLAEPPKKPPAKKPPTKPPPPPTIAAEPPPPPAAAAAATPDWGGSGTGIAAWLLTVTTVAGGHWAWVRVTTRRTVRRTGRLIERRALLALRTVAEEAPEAVAERTTAVRFFDVSATWTAPPPTIAPPQAQAQSFANAMRTDMRCLTSLLRPCIP